MSRAGNRLLSKPAAGAVLCNFCGDRGWYERLHTCIEFTGRKDQKLSQKRSQTEHKFVGIDGCILRDVGGWHRRHSCRNKWFAQGFNRGWNKTGKSRQVVGDSHHEYLLNFPQSGHLVVESTQSRQTIEKLVEWSNSSYRNTPDNEPNKYNWSTSTMIWITV